MAAMEPAELDRVARAHGIRLMIDVNYHLITEAGHPPPQDYFASFTTLTKLGVLPAPFASRIAACAGLRDRIVHEYDEIDPARVHEGLQGTSRSPPSSSERAWPRLIRRPRV
jgi:uncharacterized protein YutE (UPF0331/DUF86 family)